MAKDQDAPDIQNAERRAGDTTFGVICLLFALFLLSQIDESDRLGARAELCGAAGLLAAPGGDRHDRPWRDEPLWLVAGPAA